MYRSYWEIDALARHRIADIRQECEHYTQVEAGKSRADTPLTLLRHQLGIALIQIGQSLAEQDAKRRAPAPPSRPAVWGQPSF